MRGALGVGLVLLCSCGGDTADGPQPVEITQAPSAREPEAPPAVARCRFDAPSNAVSPTLRAEVVFEPPGDPATARATIAAHDPPASDPAVLEVVAAAMTDLYRVERDRRTLEQAIRTWATLIQSFPNHDRMDEVLYQLGWGLTEIDQHDRARQVFHRLIRGFPTSPRVAVAYVHYGDFYLRDGDARAASQFFERARAMVGENLELGGYVTYGSLWARRLMSEGEFEGRDEFRRLRDEMNARNTARALRLAEALEAEWCQQPS